MDVTEHRREVMRAYMEATRELRARHDDEFHSILHEIYYKRGIDVRKRRSRKQAAKDRVEAARKLLEQSNTD